MKLSPEAIYSQLGQLITAMPDFSAQREISPEALSWLGRIVAIVETMNDVADAVALKEAADDIHHPDLGYRRLQSNTITTILHRALARAELNAPASMQGAFIPANSPFAALQAVGKVLAGATGDVLIVDPYCDAVLLSDFAVLAPPKVAFRVLTDKQHHKPSLQPAADRWVKQYAQERPLEIRLAPSKALHDRLILVDKTEAWTVGQSFKNLTDRGHTSINRVDPETAKLKIDAYAELWDASVPL